MHHFAVAAVDRSHEEDKKVESFQSEAAVDGEQVVGETVVKGGMYAGVGKVVMRAMLCQQEVVMMVRRGCWDSGRVS